MKGDDLNTYISSFQSLARKAEYTLDEEVTLEIHQQTLGLYQTLQ